VITKSDHQDDNPAGDPDKLITNIMPEGPEIATCAHQLSALVGSTITNWWYSNDAKISGLDPIFPEIIRHVISYGKKLIIVGDHRIYIFSYGMEGRLSYHDDNPSLPYLRILFILTLPSDEIKYVAFEDSRKLGNLVIAVDYSSIAKLGPDMLALSLSNELTIPLIRDRLMRYPRRKLADTLIDQEVIAGIGNYLRSEIMFYARLYPLRIVNTLSETEWDMLARSISYVIMAAFHGNGLSIRSYISPNGSLGTYQCAVYHQSSVTVDNVTYPVIRLPHSGRSLFYVPQLQI
jgi:endonuclease-8